MRKTLLIAVIVFATVAAAHPMAFEDLAAMKRLGTPALSPDGKWIAYTATSIDLAKNARNNVLWVMRSDGTAPREIAEGDGAAWSPDGKTIAYVASGQIALYDVANAATLRKLEVSGGASSLKWLPDGSGLLVVSDVVVEEKSTAPRVIDHLLFRHWNQWQGATRAHILHVPLTGIPRDLTPGPHDAPPFSVGGGNEFDVSPDGKFLVYARNTDADAARSTNSDLFLVPLSGGETTRITSRTGADTSPVYSPDGRWIAYRSQARQGYESDLWELWLYDPAAGTSKRIAADFPNYIDSVTWAPDSKSMLVTAPLEGRHAIYEITLPDVVNARAMLVHNAGSADGIQIARDRTIYFQMSTLSRPADIYALRQDTTKKLTTHNDMQLASLTMASYEPTWWTGAENARVHGWLLKPPNFDATKKYPAVVLIHGGPQGAWGEGWSYRWNPQMFAARGYVVLMPNPRGSTGFGQEFIEEISQDWAGKVYTDIMNGVDMLATQPYVDANRMGAAGASYGGYMVNWIAGHTNRFKALVSHAGLFNLHSMYGATEELWFPEWEFGGTPWDNPEMYDKLSPHRSVKNFATPTLVSHGELDYRVPIGEGLQMFTALQRRGVPSRFLYFPDEGHWVLKPQNSKVWHQTVLDWLDGYLK
ncbi:MAG TPA: S9 family peptidase [Thermoanaerobaculia bacterium]|nr:S9 family peptidase [Thermoanaerobaculia bacterium]